MYVLAVFAPPNLLVLGRQLGKLTPGIANSGTEDLYQLNSPITRRRAAHLSREDKKSLAINLEAVVVPGHQNQLRIP